MGVNIGLLLAVSITCQQTLTLMWVSSIPACIAVIIKAPMRRTDTKLTDKDALYVGPH